MQSVFQCLHRGGDAAAAVDHDRRAVLADGHDGRVAQQAAEVQHVAGFMADGGDDAHGGGLAVHHADGGFVGDQGADDGRGGVARDDDHIDAHRADSCHGFQLFDGQAAALGGVDHAVVLADGDESARQAANVVGGHDAALLDRVVQQGQAGGGAAAAAGLKAHLFEDVGHAVAHGGGGGQRQVDDAGGYAQLLRGEVCHQLTHAGDLEGGALHQLGHLVDGGILGQPGQRGADRAGAGDADVDLAVGLTGTVEGTRHKGIVLGRVAEDHKLCCADALTVGGELAGRLDGLTHQFDGVHVQARLGGTDVHRAADDVRLGQCAGDGLDEAQVARREALVDEGGVAAHEVDAHLLAGGVEGLGKVHRVGIRAGTQQHGDGGDADALVDDGDAVLGADVLHSRNEPGGAGGDLVINFFAGFPGVRVDAVQQTDAHGDGAHVQIVLSEHLDGLENVTGIKHTHSCVLPPSDGVHGIKNFLTGNIDLHAHLGGQCIAALVQLFVAHIAVADIHQHDHGEHALQDALGHVLDIDVQFGAQTSDLGNNAHGIVTNDGNECFHRFHPRFLVIGSCRKKSQHTVTLSV